jgi:hypothetical protein
MSRSIPSADHMYGNTFKGKSYNEATFSARIVGIILKMLAV